VSKKNAWVEGPNLLCSLGMEHKTGQNAGCPSGIDTLKDEYIYSSPLITGDHFAHCSAGSDSESSFQG
jgi:hypothetical protein